MRTPEVIASAFMRKRKVDGFVLLFSLVAVLSGCGDPAPKPTLRIASIAAQATYVGEPLEITVTVTGAALDNVSIRATSSNPALVADLDIGFSRVASAFLLAITPRPFEHGVTTITLNARDSAGREATTAFDLSVHRDCQKVQGPCPPQVAPIDNQQLYLGETAQVEIKLLGDVDQPYTLSATSNDQRVVPDAALVITGSRSERLLTISSAHSGVGEAEITLTAINAVGRQASAAFHVAVAAPFDTARQRLALALNYTGGIAVSDHLAVVGEVVDVDGATLGNAYLFANTGTEWVHVDDLAPYIPRARFDDFGAALAISGDRIVVGAPGTDRDEFGDPKGAVYVFQYTRSAGVELQATLTDPEPAVRSGLGASVAIDDETVVIGAPAINTAYVFSRSPTGTWSQTAKLTPGLTAPPISGEFGSTVALNGDMLVVGEPDPTGLTSGSAFVFERSGNAWSQTSRLTPGGGPFGGAFGTAVAVADDLVVIGAPSGIYESVQASSVYVFRRNAGAWLPPIKLVSTNTDYADGFGSSLALNDGYLLVGAFGDRLDTQLNGSFGQVPGSAYIFARGDVRPGSWQQVTKLEGQALSDGERFGCFAALSRDTALIGTCRGSVYAFRK